jgi:hypothetical protein
MHATPVACDSTGSIHFITVDTGRVTGFRVLFRDIVVIFRGLSDNSVPEISGDAILPAHKIIPMQPRQIILHQGSKMAATTHTLDASYGKQSVRSDLCSVVLFVGSCADDVCWHAADASHGVRPCRAIVVFISTLQLDPSQCEPPPACH